MENYYTELSQRFLAETVLGNDTASLRRELFYIKLSSLERKLDTDDLKKEFWINIYNAFFIIIQNEPKPKGSFLKYKRIKIANNLFSLNDIELGILRKQKFNIGFLNLTNPFSTKLISRLSVSTTDTSIALKLNKNNAIANGLA
ncbi:DUF547 domain-containing protein [Flavobacterium restrictum]|uniref:DUF547 domain-containing protein n=1 Tax=Flavobacterium restrictum TaxID=2594428 RepID=A0A553E5W8_9FLAO|nr:DUF547 domain-containing protein [Flavobacterium restrictum]TRX40424.1 DUF547 domain-containing protein [Flavobacterium restrictum]